MTGCRDGRNLQVLSNLEQPSIKVASFTAIVILWFVYLDAEAHPLKLNLGPSLSREQLRCEVGELLRLCT